MDDTFSDCEVYCNQMLRRKRGFPLYVPGPQINLPTDYQKTGIQIGDVGRVTPEGIFDFFFNIYLPADHPVNDNDVPEDFYPLPWHYSLKDVFELHYDPGSCVSTSCVEMVHYEQLTGNFLFNCEGPQGAVLALPDGAYLKKLENLELIRAYVTANAEKWYKYIKGPRGRELANGSLYLVTGHEKTSSWGMSSFHSVRKGFQLELKQMRASWDDIGLKYYWCGNPGNPTQTKKCIDPTGPSNQTPFIHGLSISLGTGIWGRLFGTVEIREIVESRLESAGGKPMSRLLGSSWFSWSLGLGGGGTMPGGEHHAGETSHVVLSDLSPIAKIFHPGELINSYILQKAPQATVVMSHDDDWGNILRDDPTGPKIQNVSEFLQRIGDQFRITEKDGATFLSPLRNVPHLQTLEDLVHPLSDGRAPHSHVSSYPHISSDVRRHPTTGTPRPIWSSLVDSIPSSPPHPAPSAHGYNNSGTQYPTTAYTAGTQYPNTNTQYPASQPHGYSHGASNTMYTSPHAASAYSTPQYPTNYPYATEPSQYPGQFAPGTIPAPDPGTSIKQCYNCGKTNSPLWRRDPATQRTLCNACGLYLQQRHEQRPQALIDADNDEGEGEGEYVGVPDGPECSHCHTRQTSVWRRNKDGDQVCNACGVYQRLRGKERPLSLRKNKVKPRAKHTQNYESSTDI